VNQEDFQTPCGKDAVLSPSSLGAIFKAKHRQTDTVRALRQINKKRLQGGVWKDDVEGLRHLDHPHICKCHDLWEDNMSVYMILDLCKGGNLTDLSASRDSFNESSVAVLMEQMVSAVSHMHEHKMVHSDLRPENWLFDEQVTSEDSALEMSLKMIDFGLAVKHGKKGRRSFREALHNSRLPGGAVGSRINSNGHNWLSVSSDTNSEVGTTNDSPAVCRLFCLAPEQLAIVGQPGSPSSQETFQQETSSTDSPFPETEGEKADCWALGVIAYFMLSGESPFAINASPETDYSFQNARFVFMPTSIWRPVSSEAKHFIALCLQRDPTLRPTAKQLLSLPWMQFAKTAGHPEVLTVESSVESLSPTRARMTMDDPPLPTAQAILSSFDRMRHFQLIERAAILAAAFKLPQESLAELWRAFEARDMGKTGILAIMELLVVLQSLGVPCADLTHLAEEAGLGASCRIAYSEFIDDVQEFQRNTQDHAVWEVFSRFAKDGEQRVRRSVLLKALGEKEYQLSIAAKFPQLSLDRVVKELQDGGGALGIEEFKQIITSSADARKVAK